ncbi:putative signal transduction protein containing EAL and modified HD-GYP domains [Desulfosarcina cetonica]|uniref:EAL and HDOD domain-containing protein n=1 Tax=Desulfosarcina cetonica TaxID=90730 RepID=UPI0006D030D1|nr:HDOD domain-containing protein [Desulfosarcina cetonica]VTR70552.1 putative signal transduction protein containing EAL and modified HD-GYP domains [Desulfosarcina cetonica]
MTEAPITADASTEVTICRQPIFDAHRRLWGYELLCVGEPLPSARTCDLQDTALQVAASASMDVQRILHQGQVIMLNFDEIDILKKLPYALPPKLAAIQVDEQIFLKPSIPEQLASLKSDGYLIAVRGFSAEQHFSALYALADIIAVPVNYHQKTQIAELLSAIGNMDARLLARRVDDLSRFESCREAGVALFSGTFFKHPDTVTIHQMTANEVSRLKLIQRMEATDPDIDGLAETLQADAAISFRLMAYLNSAAFGFSQKIKSVQHAIRLLGWPKLKNWLRVVVLSDMGQSPEADELLQLSAQRARFLERVAQRHDFWGFDPASLHLLGLFSLLNTILATPMEEVVRYLPIENRLKRALCGDTNTEYHPLLQLAQAMEEARWEDAEAMSQNLNLKRAEVSAAFKEAMEWAGQMAAVGDAAKE